MNFKSLILGLIIGMLSGFILWGFEIVPGAIYHYKTDTEIDLIIPNLIVNHEREAHNLINEKRQAELLPITVWDDELYILSKAHTETMASRQELFHSPDDAFYGENCWGNESSAQYKGEALADAIISSWMASPLHRVWLFYEPIKTSVVSIVVTSSGQYASWSFWMHEAGEGPELIRKATKLWRKETNETIPWLEWLDNQGYPEQMEWLDRL